MASNGRLLVYVLEISTPSTSQLESMSSLRELNVGQPYCAPISARTATSWSTMAASSASGCFVSPGACQVEAHLQPTAPSVGEGTRARAQLSQPAAEERARSWARGKGTSPRRRQARCGPSSRCLRLSRRARRERRDGDGRRGPCCASGPVHTRHLTRTAEDGSMAQKFRWCVVGA